MTIEKQVKDKKPWGAAKVEVLALAPEIQNLYAENQNLTAIFKILFEQKKITIGASTFYRHAAKLVKNNPISAASNIQKNTSNDKKIFEIDQPVFEHSSELSEEKKKKLWG